MSTPVAAGELTAADFRVPPHDLHAAHISNVEQSHAFTDAVVGFLTQR